MAHVCPWWFVRSFDNPLRRWFHKSDEIFGSSVRPGMRVLDVGCGAGFNTESLARLVGPEGRVVAVDLQPRMLAMTEQRLRRSGVTERVDLIEARVDDLGLDSQAPFDFAVAFWMVHEVTDVDRLFKQLRRVLNPGATVLVCEPKLHVASGAFENSVQAALRAGFEERSRPKISLSRSVLFVRR
jgi:ubiquinone/menaquinone biosynthesis C-methylase UbiE